MAEEAGLGDGQDSFGNHRFNHQVQKSFLLIGLEVDYLSVSLEKLDELCLVKVFGPFGGVGTSADDRELQQTVGKVGNGRRDSDRVKVEDGGESALTEEHISRVPVAVDDLLGPGIETKLVDVRAGAIVKRHYCFAEPLEFFVDVGRAFGAEHFDVSSHAGGIVEGASQRRPLRGETGEVPVEKSKLTARVNSGLSGAVVAVSGYEAKKLVDVFIELKDGVFFVGCFHDCGNGEVPFSKVVLNGVRESDAVEIVFSLRATLEEELSAVGDNHHFRGLAVSGSEGLYLMNGADFVVAKHLCKLIGTKMCTASRHRVYAPYNFDSKSKVVKL